MFFDFQIIAFKPVTINSPYYDENTQKVLETPSIKWFSSQEEKLKNRKFRREIRSTATNVGGLFSTR